MKKMSIKLKITLWFTLFMTLLAASAFSFLFFAGGDIVSRSVKNALRSAVADSFDEIDYDDGEWEIDDDLEFFIDGVYITVRDENGALLYGRLPSGFEEPQNFSHGNFQSVKFRGVDWSVYDMSYTDRDSGQTIWIRGVAEESGTGGNSAFATMFRLAIIALPVLVILAAIGGYLIINRAFRPVRQITATAEQIGSGSDLTQRIALGDGKDEIYTLAAAFDRMFDRLQAAFERERQFTSDASHELRTPTAVIISQCEYALENANSTEEARQALGNVLEQARRMSALISQLLTLSRADRGQAKLNLELINLSELSEMVTEQISEQAVSFNIAVSSEIQPDILIYGDETMLMRMLLNLMDNGLKYGRSGGHLSLALYRWGNRVVGEVADDGIGISPEHLGKIWERFYQVDPSRSGEGGSGLGLSMVKYIVTAHGGTIYAESTPGHGSKFTFTLPL